MTSDRVVASEALFSMVTEAEPRLKTLKPWFEATVKTIDKWYSSEGNQGVARAKDVLGAAWQHVLFGKSDPLAFVKSEGTVPLLVKPLVDRVKALSKTARLLSAVLSLVRVTDLWEGRPDEATVSAAIAKIVDPVLPAGAGKVIREFSDFLDTLLSVPAYDRIPFIQALREPLVISQEAEYYYASNKKGPNGPLMENAHLDLVTLRHSVTSKGSTLLSEIGYLQDKICEYQDPTPGKNRWRRTPPRVNGKPMTLEAFTDEELLRGMVEGQKLATCPGKLALKYEKSGKVRIIAMPDYYTQEVMYPIGQWLRGVLKALPADCTFDQTSAVPKIQAWQREGRTVFSFDQTSCTDLFPVSMQTVVLEKCFDKQFADSVQTVLTDREWEITYPKSGRTTRVRWPVGQPLGVYASWPLMAVTHHLLVQFASWRATSCKQRWKPFGDYVICGDDIVIGSVAVANSYLRLVKELGMKINKSKSYVSGGKTKRDVTSEFAKMIVWKTNLLYPIRPKQLMSAIQDWRLAVPLLWELHDPRRWNLKRASLKAFIRRFFTRGSRYLDFLLTVPHLLGGCGLKGLSSLRSEFSSIIKTGTDIHPLLHYIAKRIRSKLLAGRRKALVRETGQVKGFARLDRDAFNVHPIVENFAFVSTQEWRDHIWERPVPELDEILLELIKDGISSYSQLLIGQLLPGPRPPGYDWESDVRKASNTWRQVLDNPRHLESLATTPFWDGNLSLSLDEDLLNESTGLETLSDYSAELQLQRVCDIVDMLNAANSGSAS